MTRSNRSHRRGTLSACPRITSTLAIAAGLVLASASFADGCNCPGDLNSSGAVDAADLAVLLGTWGTANASADLNGSGLVDAGDLGILLGGWGSCGAPANDDCSDAIILPSIFWQDVDLCTMNATTDGPASSACDASNSDQIYDDVWYKVAAPTDGMLQVTSCGADFDTRLAIYEPGLFGATCPSTSFITAFMLGCNDDSLACSNSLNSRVLVPVTVGDTYTIRAGGYLGASGNGTLAIDFFQKGDLIEDAIHVDLDDNGLGAIQILTGDTLHATPSAVANPNTCGGANDSKDIWFKVEVQCNNGGEQLVGFTVSTCMPGTNFDTTLTVYSGPIDNLTEVECNDDHTFSSCLLNGVERKSFISIDPAGSSQVYWVRLAGFNGAVGSYEIKFTGDCL